MTTAPEFHGHDSIVCTRLGVESVVANQWLVVKSFPVEGCRCTPCPWWAIVVRCFHCISEFFMNRHDARICRILPLKHEVVSVSQSFSLSRVAGYLDRLQVVQIRTIFQRPPKICLSVSVWSFVWPPSCNRCILSFLAISDSVYGFPVVVLPLLISTASCRGSARMSILLKNFVCVLLRGYQTLSASTVDCAFFGMLQANKTLSCSDCFAKFVQLNALLDCALIPRWTRWLRLLASSLWWWTCLDTRLAIYQPKFASRSSAPRLCRCRLDTPGTRRWT